MSQFTPGPWEAERYVKPRTHERVVMAPGLNPIALVHDGDIHAEADARLIAAAPELYEACKLALGFFDKDAPMDFEDAEAECERVTQLCRAAISKAKGNHDG